MSKEEELNALIRGSFRNDNGEYYCERISEYLLRNYYKSYIDLYEKYEEHTTGFITVKTDDSVCSYILKTKDGDIIDGTNIPPYCEADINLNDILFLNYELYIYKGDIYNGGEGIVRIRKEKLHNIDAPFWLKHIAFWLLLFLPYIVFVILILMNIVSFKGFGYNIFYVLYIEYFILVSNYKYNKNKKLNRKRNIYLNAYRQGRLDMRIKLEKEKKEHEGED